jgi:hypothetical protein
VLVRIAPSSEVKLTKWLGGLRRTDGTTSQVQQCFIPHDAAAKGGTNKIRQTASHKGIVGEGTPQSHEDVQNPGRSQGAEDVLRASRLKTKEGPILPSFPAGQWTITPTSRTWVPKHLPSGLPDAVRLFLAWQEPEKPPWNAIEVGGAGPRGRGTARTIKTTRGGGWRQCRNTISLHSTRATAEAG